jgi:hypothetical protein
MCVHNQLHYNAYIKYVIHIISYYVQVEKVIIVPLLFYLFFLLILYSL